MKTTKKGFTLIELIVVIAIIGVLAALLVPNMLGYVKKSKIQAANSAASEYCKAVSSAIADVEEEDKDVADGTLKCTNGNFSTSSGTETVSYPALKDYVKTYTDITGNSNFQCCIKGGTAIYGAAKSGKYFGTYPKVYSQKNYPSNCSITTALNAASSQYVKKHGAVS